MNAVEAPQVMFRSLATRGASEVPEAVDDAILACKAAGHDLVIVETPGIGQGHAGIVDHVDLSVYVMTPEYGAASQLEKIDMLDLADVVVVNKLERRGAEDALRDVRKQVARNREAFGTPPEALPVFGTIAARFNDDGVTALYQHLRDELAGRGLPVSEGRLAPVPHRASTKVSSIVPPSRSRYLAEIAEAVRAHHRRTEAQAEAVRRVQHLRTARAVLSEVHGARAEHDGRRSSSAVAELTAAIEAVMKDTSWFSQTVIEKLAQIRHPQNTAAPNPQLADLTVREREILGLMCQGLNDTDIAKTLHVSQHTVRNHVASLYSKLQVHRRSAVIVWARERGIVGYEQPKRTRQTTER